MANFSENEIFLLFSKIALSNHFKTRWIRRFKLIEKGIVYKRRFSNNVLVSTKVFKVINNFKINLLNGIFNLNAT